MTVTFFINYLNHHQVWVADELYAILGDNFRFVATLPPNPSELKGGEDYTRRPYCLMAATSAENDAEAHRLNVESNVCVYGAGCLSLMHERAATGRPAIEMGERWLKRGWINALSPRLLKWWWLYQTRLRRRPFYRLCSGAYVAKDLRHLGTYRKRCYRWGYFTSTPTSGGSDNVMRHDTPRMMWCARLIPLKHCEHVIEAARILRDTGYNFSLDIYGDGPEKEHIATLIEKYGLGDRVILHGSRPNDEIQQAMRDSDIFIFTSNRLEGWGAVLNEAMGNGCCPVASDAVGAAPYLIKDGINGLTYRSGSVDALTKALRRLLDNPDATRRMTREAERTLHDTWSPRSAANALITLCRHLTGDNGAQLPNTGPCSPA